jgi:hypothetical protein
MNCTRDEIEVFLGPPEVDPDMSTATAASSAQDQDQVEEVGEEIQPKQVQSTDQEIQIQIEGEEEGQLQEGQQLLLPQIPETVSESKELTVLTVSTSSEPEDLLEAECSLCGSTSFQNSMEHCKTCGLIVHNYCMPRSILLFVQSSFLSFLIFYIIFFFLLP